MTYAEALRSPSRIPRFKIEWMDKNEQVVNEITSDLLSGSINITLQNGVRRTCQLNLNNKNGDYIPDKNGLIWLEKKFKVYTGLQINGTDYFNEQGLFNLGNPINAGYMSERTAQIEAYDNFALLNGSIGGELDADYVIDVGSSLTDVVAQVFTDAGVIKSPIIYPNSEVLPYTITKKIGDTYESILTELAAIVSWDVFFDTDGRPRFQPPVNTDIANSVWDFGSTEVTWLGSDHNYDFLAVKNYIVVIGDNINGDLAYATAQDDNIFSPTSVARIGKRTKTIEDSNIYSDDLAQDRADYELKKAIQIIENADMKCIPIDTLKEGEIVTIDDSDNGFNRERYIIKSINLNLNYNQEQTLNVSKVYSTIA